ncbi:MAG: 50S ribosomal protein L13 [Candidatus Bilamarchaeaceae archaeon]
MIVVDAENARLGRVSAFVAKKLLQGEEVHIINAENAIISGNPLDTIAKYQQRRRLRYKGDPERSPYWPKVPYLFVKRLVRGMLPRKKPSGRAAHGRLKVHEGKPAEIKAEVVRVPGADKGELTKYITVSELCKHLGYNKR